MTPAQKAEKLALARKTLAEVLNFCRPAERPEVATVLGELAVRYHREAGLSEGQLGVLYEGYHQDLSDIPAGLWPLMGQRYRNTPGKSFFPQVWELREAVQPELDRLNRKREACEAIIAELDTDSEIKASPYLTKERLAEIKKEMANASGS